MSWSSCGTDSIGRPIGYSHEATCDHPECSVPIDRGLAHACGGSHGETEISSVEGSSSVFTCDRYFCSEHLLMVEAVFDGAHSVQGVCASCLKGLDSVLQETGTL